MVTKAEKHEVGTWSFYVVWVIMFIVEGAIVKFLGFWLSGALFLVAGPLLGMFSYKTTDPTHKPRDPFIKAATWLVNFNQLVGFLIGSLIAGPMGMGVTYRKLNNQGAPVLTILSGVWFAVFWVPAFYFVLG